MGLIGHPNVLKIAEKFVLKFNIKPPFDLKSLVAQFAEVHYKAIPFEGVDGVTINLSMPGKRPKVIVNSKMSKTRQNFTLAHELGHLIIPWHIGTIIDTTDSIEFANEVYKRYEKEANEFAAEILMPDYWVKGIINSNYNILEKHQTIISDANVSPLASGIKLLRLLPKGWIFINVNISNSKIENIGKSQETIASIQSINEIYTDNFYSIKEKEFSFRSNRNKFIWIKLKDEIDLEAGNNSSWKDLLIEILADIYPLEMIRSVRISILAIISAVDSRIWREDDYSLNKLIANSINSLNRKDLLDLVNHDKFNSFIYSRCNELFNNKANKYK